MKKIWILLIFLVVVILMVVAFIIYKNNKSDSVSKNNSPNLVLTKENLDQQLFEDVLKNSNSEICYGMSSIDSRNFCYNALAVELIDNVLCAKIENSPEKQKGCYDSVVERESLLNDDIIKCNAIIDNLERDVCFTRIAVVYHKVDICGANSEDKTKGDCQSIFYSQKDSKLTSLLSCMKTNDSIIQRECLDAVTNLK